MLDTLKMLAVGNDKKKAVLRFPFTGIENAFVIVSFKSQMVSREHISTYTRYREPYYPCEPMLSFFYGGENSGAEWMPEHGPIMVYTKCGPDWVGETLRGSPLKAKPHWFYEYVEDNALAWSQLAVDDERLPQKLANSDYVGLFSSLKKRALRNDNTETKQS